MIYTINGKNYESKQFDFAALVKLEECGVSMSDFTKLDKPLTLIVALTAWLMDCSKEKATKEINEHLSNGGTFEDLVKIFETIKESDFFKKAMTQH